ncbi:MAG: YbaB/EbfC family nucleoid-associated protein [Bacteroidota bacterium]
MTDFTQMFGQMKEAQAKIQEVQQQVSQLQAVGEAGAGLVKATVTGSKQVRKIDIDPIVFDASEREMLQDLIAAAVNLAIQAVEDKAKEVIKQSTAGMLGDIPLELMV